MCGVRTTPRARSKVRSEIKISGQGGRQNHSRSQLSSGNSTRFRGVIGNSKFLKCRVGTCVTISGNVRTTKARIDLPQPPK